MDRDALPDIWSLVEGFFTSQPQHKAIISTKLSIDYGQLQKEVINLSQALESCLPETFRSAVRSVILHLPNSVSYVMCILALVYLRRPFTSLPVDWPVHKQNNVLMDVRGSVVIVQRSNKDRFPNARELLAISSTAFCIEEDLLVLYLPEYEGHIDLAPDCCYVIFTSGSTGTPKGVQCVRSGVTNLVQGQVKVLDLGPDDVTGQFASVAYDAVISEVFTVFVSGGTLAVLYQNERLGDELVEAVQTLGITVITLVPSLLEVLDPEDFGTLRKLLTAGEACSVELAARWLQDGRIRLFNAYGPAENTVCATMYELTVEKLKMLKVKDKEGGHGQGLPIGNGIPNVDVRLLDDTLQEVPVGQEGEIHIGGLSLSKGYIGQVASRFIKDPARPGGDAMLYKTEDIAVKDSQGDLVFLRRVGDQVKIRGQMVSLPGVERHIQSCPGVKLVGVVFRQDNQSLVAFISPPSVDVDEIKDILKGKLSSFEIPSYFRLLDIERFPRNNNDKIDRKQLERMCLDLH